MLPPNLEEQLVRALALLLVQVAEPSVRNAVLAMGVIGIPTATRIIRSSTLVVQSTDYVEAARSLGATNTRILFRHILPNIASVMLIAFSIGIGAYIIFEATISFLGVGPRGVVSWGKMVNEGRANLEFHPWLTVFAGGAISTMVTWLPKRAKACASSQPMGPPPSTSRRCTRGMSLLIAMRVWRVR